MSVMNDPIADMLTRIRNAINARQVKVPMPSSKVKTRIAEVLKSEGFIQDFSTEKVPNGIKLTVELRYDDNRESVITGIKRISSPGLRRYVRSGEIPTVRNGLGIAILSTSSGVITDREARKRGVGGELIATVW